MVECESDMRKKEKERITNWEELSKFLKEKRKTFGLTQSQMSKECGISRSMIGMVEQGKRRYSAAYLMKVLYYFAEKEETELLFTIRYGKVTIALYGEELENA